MKNTINVKTKEHHISSLSIEEVRQRESNKENRLAATSRSERDIKLSQSDWTQVSDAPVNQAAWATYRQALRDIPEQEGFPNNIDWPVEP